MLPEKKGKIIVINRDKQSPHNCPAVSPIMKYARNGPEVKAESFGEKVKEYAPKVADKLYSVLKKM
jgi:hypothetical protein